MKNVLFINFPAEGHVNPTLGMTKAFADRGTMSIIFPQKNIKTDWKE